MTDAGSRWPRTAGAGSCSPAARSRARPRPRGSPSTPARSPGRGAPRRCAWPAGARSRRSPAARFPVRRAPSARRRTRSRSGRQSGPALRSLLLFAAPHLGAAQSHPWPTCNRLLQSQGRSAPTPNETTARTRQPKQVTPVHRRHPFQYPNGRESHTARRIGARTALLPGFQRLRSTEEPCPNKPWLAVTATRAPSTWWPVAVPRSCHTHSHTWAMAWAGIASPKHERPPEGFTGTRPPSAVTPSRSSFSASPSPHRPMSSYQSSSRADERS